MLYLYYKTAKVVKTHVKSFMIVIRNTGKSVIFMKRMIKFITLLVIITLCTMIVSFADSTIAYFSRYPKDISIYISRPEISMKLMLNDNSIETIKMKLDGKEVGATYDAEREMIVYKPMSPLSPGLHTIDLEVHISGWSNFLAQSWSFTVRENALTSFPSVSDEQKQALNYVNAFRESLGLSSLSINYSLNAAANAHTNYMILNSRTTHDELQSNKGYSGGTPFTRAKSYGYNGIAIAENVSSGFNDLTKALQEFISAPYHRLAWLNPYAQDFGYFGKNGYHTLLFGSMMARHDEIVTYPYSNQTDVPINWENTETPDPLRNTSDSQIGYPITISYFSDRKVTSVEIEKFTIEDSLGNDIKKYSKSPENDEYLIDSIIIIPEEPLKGNTKYYVSAILTVYFEGGEHKKVSHTFSFRTENKKTYAYDDIENHWAVDVIDELAQKKIVTARDANHFRPDAAITRGEFSLYVSKMLGLNLRNIEGTFSDVSSDTPNSNYIEAAQRYGIIKGYQDGTFQPNKLMTRQEMAAVMKRTYEIKTRSTTDTTDYSIRFTDNADISSWAVDSVKLCSKLGIINGRTDGSFDPFDSTTRAEAVVMIDRLMEAID